MLAPKMGLCWRFGDEDYRGGDSVKGPERAFRHARRVQSPSVIPDICNRESMTFSHAGAPEERDKRERPWIPANNLRE